ncbi:MAG: type II toxin-antitoxin system VapC family toxin [Pseudomonadota bacterium]|nr:type II toxin-antitoxin system VapC family toxin [Pseudomonadota bacterium]
MNKVLLDTNAYTSYLGGDQDILNVLAGAEIVFMSIFVLGELYAGFKGGNRNKENIDILRTFMGKSSVAILNASHETAEVFGMVKTSLKRAGTPIPINDVWIASHALETGAVMISHDKKHFTLVPGLRLWYDS